MINLFASALKLHNRMTDKISISIFVDGDETHFLDTIKEIWSTHWDANYAELGELIFNEPINR
jgi:hypothetical protein